MSERVEELRKGVNNSNVIQARKYKREWNNRDGSKVFQRSYLLDISVKHSKSLFSRMNSQKNPNELDVWDELMVAILALTDKDINVKYSDFPDIGLSFDDIKEHIYDKDNSSYHRLLDDRNISNGNIFSVLLKRWIWFLNFGDILDLGRKPRMIKEYDEVRTKCLAYTNVGIKLNESDEEKVKRGNSPRGYTPCTAKCIIGINFCGKHKTWGSKKEHLWKGKGKNDKTVSNIVCGAC